MEFFSKFSNDSSINSTVTLSALFYLQKTKSFNFYFNLKVRIYIFKRIEVLNTTLQKIELNVMESHTYLRTMICRNNIFQELWINIKMEAEKLELEIPTLPRIRKAPKKYETHLSPYVFTRTISKAILWNIRYFYNFSHQSLAIYYNEHTARFWKFYIYIYLEKVILFYKTENFDIDRLTLHRNVFYDLMKNEVSKYSVPKDVTEVVNFLNKNIHILNSVPELVKLIRIILTIPTSTCTCDRSFSSMRRLKT